MRGPSYVLLTSSSILCSLAFTYCVGPASVIHDARVLCVTRQLLTIASTSATSTRKHTPDPQSGIIANAFSRLSPGLPFCIRSPHPGTLSLLSTFPPFNCLVWVFVSSIIGCSFSFRFPRPPSNLSWAATQREHPLTNSFPRQPKPA